jgi:hypothetical protein
MLGCYKGMALTMCMVIHGHYSLGQIEESQTSLFTPTIKLMSRNSSGTLALGLSMDPTELTDTRRK